MMQHLEWNFDGIGEELTVRLSPETLDMIDGVLALDRSPFKTKQDFAATAIRWALQSLAEEDDLTLMGLVEN
jgi:hypothetical protein